MLARIRTDVPVPFDADALRYRGATRERCFQIFNELGFRAFVGEYAPTADTIAKNYRIVEHRGGPGGTRGAAASGRTLRACACCRTRRRRCARASSASSFSTATA